MKPNHLELKDLPARCEIELSSACNLKCTYCPRRHLDPLKGFMDVELFESIIRQLPYETILTLHRRGESLLHPQFGTCLDLVRDRFKEIQLATNATLLDKDKSFQIIDAITFLSFSIDAPERFDLTRSPARYAEVEENILRFLDLNQGTVTTQVSMVQTNETSKEEVDHFRSLWERRVDRVRIYQEHSSDGRFGSLGEKRPERAPCSMPFYEILVFSDGKVGRCNHDWNGAPLGDLNVQTIKEVWTSEAYQALRDQHLNLKITDQVCGSCDSWYPVKGQQQTGQVYVKR